MDADLASFDQASLFGPAIAPLIGGIATHYASWRYAQWALFVMGLFALIPVALWLPETLDPEKLQRTREERKGITSLNPFSSLALLRAPNILILVRLRLQCSQLRANVRKTHCFP